MVSIVLIWLAISVTYITVGITKELTSQLRALILNPAYILFIAAPMYVITYLIYKDFYGLASNLVKVWYK